MKKGIRPIDGLKSCIQNFVENYGPDPHQYDDFTALMNSIEALKQRRAIRQTDIKDLREIFGKAMLTCHTLQGHVCVKPYKYAGDFEIIDKIYTGYVNNDKQFSKWDLYFQEQAAPKAVRNRKKILKNWLRNKPQNISVLSLVSGPCRDIMEFYQENPETDILIDTIEYDPNSIVYAKKLFERQKTSYCNINFIKENIYRFTPQKKYDAIWSSGLFDYLNDKAFVGVIQKLLYFLKPDGEIVLGNFHPNNPSKSYMEFGEWTLNYRTAEQLRLLAIGAGIKEDKIKIKEEKEGVNLFLHIYS